MSSDQENNEERARIERAKRLHEEIDSLKKGERPDPNRPRSIKEQVDERSREQRDKT
jgi:hypothetical protein